MTGMRLPARRHVSGVRNDATGYWPTRVVVTGASPDAGGSSAIARPKSSTFTGHRAQLILKVQIAMDDAAHAPPLSLGTLARERKCLSSGIGLVRSAEQGSLFVSFENKRLNVVRSSPHATSRRLETVVDSIDNRWEAFVSLASDTPQSPHRRHPRFPRGRYARRCSTPLVGSAHGGYIISFVRTSIRPGPDLLTLCQWAEVADRDARFQKLLLPPVDLPRRHDA